jgi:predicted AAA+ superfamily ATPase
MFARPSLDELLGRLREPRRFIQVLAGPRQVGKTTLAHQAIEALDMETHFASADRPGLEPAAWIGQQWDLARLRAREAGTALLVLDEVQKIDRWSDVIKALWDEDSAADLDLRVLLLGSSPLLMQSGLTESLAGRFELIRVAQWSFAEMRDAFGWDLDRYLYFGGYPGAAPLITDERRWSAYIRDALIETTISRDILLMQRVVKPALLRRLFQLGCDYSGQILSYNKMLGQLQDAGNTTTLAHYLDLLSGAGLVTGLQKIAKGKTRQRASSPKLHVHDTALMTATAGRTLESARRDRSFWGRLVESAVGAHLLHTTAGRIIELTYWRHRDKEVDFVLARGERLVPIEVKSGRARGAHPGTAAFVKRHEVSRRLLVGEGGVGLEEFLLSPADRWLT